MTTPGDRFKGWIDGLATSWSERLGLWAGKFIAGGIQGILDVLGKAQAPLLKAAIERLEATKAIPPELKPILDEIKQPKGEIAALSGVGFLNRVVGAIKGDIFEYFTRQLTRAFSYSADFFLPGTDVLLEYYLRGIIPDKDNLYSLMRNQGIPPEETDKLLKAKQALFPSDIVAPAWLRDKQKYTQFWDDVRKVMGLTSGLRQDEMRIELLQELAYRVPGAQDVIRYAVKEAYSPDVYTAFGQDKEFPTLALADAEAAGVREAHLLKEWIAHWVLPSTGQGFDLLHRGKITAEELNKLLKALDIMPFWRDKLTELSWDLPNRVEMRMLARYGLVDKPFLVKVLGEIGLREDYRVIIADLMLAQGMMTDLRARYANKWIDSHELRDEITRSGLSPDVQNRLYSWIVKNSGPERTTAEKDLTAAEIIKGVKKGIITWEDGLQRLGTLGYDEAEAVFKLAIEIEVVEEEPTSELTVRVDTIRRKRRQRLITREDEIDQLLLLRLDTGLAEAYADNDDLRLVKEVS